MFGRYDHSSFDALDHIRRVPRPIPETCLVVMEQDTLLKQYIEVVEQEKRQVIRKKKTEETAGRPSMIEAVMDSYLRDVKNSGM